MGHAAPSRPADLPQSVTIPLERIEGGDRLPVFRIRIALGGGPAKPYLLDSGGAGMFAAGSPQGDGGWWPDAGVRVVRPASENHEQEYGGGTRLVWQTVTTSIDLGGGLVVDDIEIGRIVDAWGGELGERGSGGWQRKLASGEEPIPSWGYGNFGIDLRDGVGLMSVLSQLPGNLASGFVIRTGGPDGSAPSIVVGLTDELRRRCRIRVAMNAGSGARFPHSGMPLYAQQIIDADYELRAGDDVSSGEGSTGGGVTRFRAGTLLDTGGGATTLLPGGVVRIPDGLVEGGHLRRGSDLRASVRGVSGEEHLLFGLRDGPVLRTDQVRVRELGGESGFVNAGILPFLRFDVMFDLQNGIVGFAPKE